MTATGPLADLAAILTDGRWDRALDLAAACRSPLRVTVGGGGSVGGHSDPTAAAALDTTTVAIPTATDLRRSLRRVHAIVETPSTAIDPTRWLAGKLIGIAQIGDPGRALLVAVNDTLHVHARVLTPRTVADWLLSKEPAVDPTKTKVRACEACETPVEHCGRIRAGWCDACYALARLWITSKPELVDDDLALDHARFATAVAQAIAAGDVVRPWSPHRPVANLDTGTFPEP